MEVQSLETTLPVEGKTTTHESVGEAAVTLSEAESGPSLLPPGERRQAAMTDVAIVSPGSLELNGSPCDRSQPGTSTVEANRDSGDPPNSCSHQGDGAREVQILHQPQFQPRPQFSGDDAGQMQHEMRMRAILQFQQQQLMMQLQQQQQQQQQELQQPVHQLGVTSQQQYQHQQPQPQQFFGYDGELYEEDDEGWFDHNPRRNRGPLSVRFAPNALLHHSTRDEEDIPPLWYTRDDLAKFKRERKAIVRALKRINFDASRIDQSVHSLRGLEAYQSISYNKIMQAKRAQAIKVVLQAQARSRAFHQDHVDDELLRQESIRASEWARERALELGRADAMELGHAVPPMEAFESIEQHMDDEDCFDVPDHESVPSLASTVASMDNDDFKDAKDEKPLPVPDPKTRIRFDIFADLENDDLDDYDEDIPLTPVPIALMQLQAYCDSQIATTLSTNLWTPGPISSPSTRDIKRHKSSRSLVVSPAPESENDNEDRDHLDEQRSSEKQLQNDTSNRGSMTAA